MKSHLAQLNLLLAWIGILLGFISGSLLGLKFHHEDWLGGYGSFKRRLYRLGHISFFGLAMVNLTFYFTAQKFLGPSLAANLASWGFVVGAVSMPICCFVMAHNAKLQALFAIPVCSLLVGGILTLWEVIKL
jgi:ABC-type antimicrobial peptide transport system permease subunit